MNNDLSKNMKFQMIIDNFTSHFKDDLQLNKNLSLRKEQQQLVVENTYSTLYLVCILSMINWICDWTGENAIK